MYLWKPHQREPNINILVDGDNEAYCPGAFGIRNVFTQQ